MKKLENTKPESERENGIKTTKKKRNFIIKNGWKKKEKNIIERIIMQSANNFYCA